MSIKIPEYHEFPESLKKAFFDKTGYFLPEWEISTPRKNNLAWSIVLSYLMSGDYRDKDDFAARLKALTGSDENAELVSKSIHQFNSFKNKHFYFYNKTLKAVISNFKKCLGWDRLSDVSEKLSVVSKVLECPILLIKDYIKSEDYKFYGETVNRNKKLIVLIVFTNGFRITHHFLIDEVLQQKMEKNALEYYLNQTDIPKKFIKKLANAVVREETFIKAVLNRKYRNIIKCVYDSPYVVSKLSEIGFEMDPRTKDSNGFSGLYYALKLKERNIFYLLYNFAAENCFETDEKIRNPQFNIVSNLENIEKLLQDDISKLKNLGYHQQYNDLKVEFGEFVRLNRFLIELNKKILESKNKVNSCDFSSDIELEARERKDVMVSLLDTYKKFFNYQENHPLSPLDDYIFYKEYYFDLDMIASIYFFTSITYLKRRLKLQNDKQYSDIESSFFFFIRHYIYFEIPECREFTQRLTYFSSYHMYIFPLMYRLNNLKNCEKFSKILRGINVSNDNVVEHMPVNEIYSILYSNPNYKNFFEMRRLLNYINISKSLKIKNIKAVLVIERILQVIGECVVPGENEKNCFSFKRLLSSCLPKEITKVLRRLRNVLTHLKGYAFPLKIKCEENVSLFRSILSEINEIRDICNFVYPLINMSRRIYYVHQLKINCRKIAKSAHLLKNSRSFLSSSFRTAKKIPVLISQSHRELLKENQTHCYSFLNMALINLKCEIENEYSSPDCDGETLKQKIIYLLMPIKWFLVILQNCRMKKVNSPLYAFKELESVQTISIVSLKKIIDTFIHACDSLLPEFKVDAKEIFMNKFTSVKHIEHFTEILKGSVFLSEDEQNEIRKEIPEDIKKQVLNKNKLIESVEGGFTSQYDIDSAEFQLTYLSKTKMKELRMLYESKDSSALSILETQDPVSELEEIFTKNCIDKKKYDKLCETMKFTEKTRKTLGQLVAGQRKKLSVNNLEILLNRIQLLKKIVIGKDKKIEKLMLKIKQEKAQQLIGKMTMRRILKDDQLRIAVEMLLFDCMILFEKVKFPDNLWSKSSKLYEGINLRNLISHGNPLVENLCLTLDPQDLPSEIVKKILFLIKSEDAVQAILDLHKHVNKNNSKLLEVIKSGDTNDFFELRNRIRNCNEWENYTRLLPKRESISET